MEIVDVLKALADETRLRIVHLLYKEVLCVCDLEMILNISQSNASRHLTKLKSAKLIAGEKQAQWVFYQVDKHVLEDYPFVKKMLDNEPPKIRQCREDAERLRKYRERGGDCEHRAQL